MSQWQTSDAKQRFSEMLDAAATGGPQLVLRHKEAVAVVLSPDDYRVLKQQADENFSRLLGQSPFAADDLTPMEMSLADGG